MSFHPAATAPHLQIDRLAAAILQIPYSPNLQGLYTDSRYHIIQHLPDFVVSSTHLAFVDALYPHQVEINSAYDLYIADLISRPQTPSPKPTRTQGRPINPKITSIYASSVSNISCCPWSTTLFLPSRFREKVETPSLTTHMQSVMVARL